nr:helix-turn-helix domain-containing protein [Virgisporangium aliadipatigenens]
MTLDSKWPERSLRADALRNRIRILVAAETVFAAKGPAAAVEDVARLAGVGVGTVYRHFATREALRDAVFAGRLQRLTDHAEHAARNPIRDGHSSTSSPEWSARIPPTSDSRTRLPERDRTQRQPRPVPITRCTPLSGAYLTAPNAPARYDRTSTPPLSSR